MTAIIQHLATPTAASFSEALSIATADGTWIFISGQVGVPMPPDTGAIEFEAEVRQVFARIRASLGKLGASLQHVINIKTSITDLGLYPIFARVRGELFPVKPPTSATVQVAGLLVNAKIEIEAIAFLPKSP
jgi:enamine deaminase RidA (YjgF/YER057c/UK114 family)